MLNSMGENIEVMADGSVIVDGTFFANCAAFKSTNPLPFGFWSNGQLPETADERPIVRDVDGWAA